MDWIIAFARRTISRPHVCDDVNEAEQQQRRRADSCWEANKHTPQCSTHQTNCGDNNSALSSQSLWKFIQIRSDRISLCWLCLFWLWVDYWGRCKRSCWVNFTLYTKLSFRTRGLLAVLCHSCGEMKGVYPPLSQAIVSLNKRRVEFHITGRHAASRHISLKDISANKQLK